MGVKPFVDAVLKFLSFGLAAVLEFSRLLRQAAFEGIQSLVDSLEASTDVLFTEMLHNVTLSSNGERQFARGPRRAHTPYKYTRSPFQPANTPTCVSFAT